MSAPTAPTASVQVSVTINAEPETVWRFLSEQEKLLSWLTYIPGSPAPAGSRFEPRPGGEVRIVFPNGGEARGSVVEIDPPRRLVFTWGYEPDVARTGLGPGACRVEVAVVPMPEGTRVTLTHAGPMSEQLAKGHEGGWRHYLSQLAARAADAQHGAHLEGTLRDYFAACNEPDEAERLALLERCCEPGVRVRSPFACTDGIGAFSAKIGNGLRHMGDAVSAIAGPVRQVHGFASVPWAVTGKDGGVMFRGENTVRFSPRGRIAEIVSFHA